MDVLLLHPTPCQRSSLAIAEDMLDSANRVAALRGEAAPFRWRTLRPEAVGPGTPAPGLVVLPGLGLASAHDLRAAMDSPAFATLSAALRHLAQPGTRIAGACTGVFALAEDCRRFLLADSRPSQLPYLSVATLVAGDPALQRAELHLRRHIARQVPLAELAEAAGLGARTFARRLARVAGMTPGEFAQTLRVTEAIRLYRAGGLSLEQIAHRVGYGDATALRRVMTRRTGRRLESFRT